MTARAPARPKKGKPRGIRLTDEQRTRYDRLAAAEGRDVSSFMILMIEKGIAAGRGLTFSPEDTARIEAAYKKAGLSDLHEFAQMAALDLTRRIEELGWPAALAPESRPGKGRG